MVKAILELKIKHGAVGDKKRLVLKTPLNLNHTHKQILADLRAEVPDDWLPWVFKADRPALINHYQRDYFVAKNTQGQCCWVYRELNNQWYIHGYFS